MTAVLGSMRSVDQRRQAARADDLFRAFMITGQIHPGLVVGPAEEALELWLWHLIPPGY